MFRYKAPLFCPFVRKAKTTHYIKDLRIEKGIMKFNLGTNVLVLFAAPGWSEKHYENPNKFDYKRWFQ
jgi:cytochrome P450